MQQCNELGKNIPTAPYGRKELVLLLGIFRRAPHPSATRGRPFAPLLPRGRPDPKKNVFYW
jgi:hypothetical protein